MMSMLFRARYYFILLFSIVMILSLVQAVWANPLQQASKTQSAEIKLQYKVPVKHLPIKRISEAMRQISGRSALGSPTLGDSISNDDAEPAEGLPSTQIVPTDYGDLPQAAMPKRVPVVSNLAEQPMVPTPRAPSDLPYHQTTWLSYYGRPNVPVMGILGEHEIEPLAQLLREKAIAYDAANGPEIGVQPAFHLVYGMATRGAGFDGSHLVFLSDEVVMAYINRAAAEGFAVILDIQIGALSPVESIQRGLEYLKYPNVHLGIDPEFAMVHPDQQYPGVPIGSITGQQINEVQAAIQQYMADNGLAGRRILLVHQFLDKMILDKQAMSPDYPVALTISVDGWGAPVEKIRRYNVFTSDYPVEFSAFKLFYQWDDPVLSERQALGVESYNNQISVNIVPNLIIYQ